MTAKIERKRKQIKQLDAILNDQANNDNSLDEIRASGPPEPEESDEHDSSMQTFLTEAPTPASNGYQSSSPIADKSLAAAICTSDVEVILTRAEEDRVRHLLQDDADDAIGDSTGDTSVETHLSLKSARNEFAMDAADKASIGQLLAANRDLRDRPILQALNVEKKEDDGQVEAESQRSRLDHIDRELQLLDESPRVTISNDDQLDAGEETNAVTQTRVISRQQFSMFVAEQTTKYKSVPTASREEIAKLLSTVSHRPTSARKLSPPVS